MPVVNYRKGTEKEKSWIIEETSFNEKYTGKCESVFTQGNGYLGLRNSLEEQYVNTVRGMFITGTFNNIKFRFHPSSELDKRSTALSTLYTIMDKTNKSKATDDVSRENSHNCLGLNFVLTE